MFKAFGRVRAPFWCTWKSANLAFVKSGVETVLDPMKRDLGYEKDGVE